jgi:hypothetical protein
MQKKPSQRRRHLDLINNLGDPTIKHQPISLPFLFFKDLLFLINPIDQIDGLFADVCLFR